MPVCLPSNFGTGTDFFEVLGETFSLNSCSFFLPDPFLSLLDLNSGLLLSVLMTSTFSFFLKLRSPS